MSDRRLARLEALIEHLERLLDVTPNIAVLRENQDGSCNLAAFARAYNGMTPEQVEAKGGTVVVRTNFKNPNLPVAHSPFKTDMQSVGLPNSGAVFGYA